MLVAGLILGPATAAAQTAGEDGPVLGRGDVVRVEVKDEPGASGEFVVGHDGAVMVPLVGLVPVAGRPFDAVRSEIRRRFATELVAPVVRVTPLVRVSVLGEVRRPGLFPVDPGARLNELLALAAGLTPLADRDGIRLLRGGERLDLDELPPGSFRSGDEVYVPRQSWLSQNAGILVSAAASVAAAAVTAVILRQ